MNKEMCPRCWKNGAYDVELLPGVALVEIFLPSNPDHMSPAPDFIGATLTPYGKSEMRGCLKCPKCGYSRL